MAIVGPSGETLDMQTYEKGRGSGKGMRPVLKEVTENAADDKAAAESPIKGETKSGATSGTDADGLGDDDAIVMMAILTDVNARQLRSLGLTHLDRLEKPAGWLMEQVLEALLDHWHVDRRLPTLCLFESKDGLVKELLQELLKTEDVPPELKDKISKALKGTKGDKKGARLEIFWRTLLERNDGDEAKAVKMCIQMRIQHVRPEAVEKVLETVFKEYGTIEPQSLRNDLCSIAMESVPPTLILGGTLLNELLRNFNGADRKCIGEAENAGPAHKAWELYTLHVTHSPVSVNVANDERSQGGGEEPVIDTTLFDEARSFDEVCKSKRNSEHREPATWIKELEKLLVNCTWEKFDKVFGNALDKIPLDATLAIFGENGTQYEDSKMTPDELARHGKHLKAEDFLYGMELKAGAHGATYLALHKDSKTPVAIKVLKKSKHRRNPSLRHVSDKTRFVCREIQLHGRLRHPNIIRMLGWFYDDTNIYLVLEYASQGDIRKVVGEGRMEDERQVARFGRDVSSALKCIHQDHGIIHSDVKLENIVKDHTGTYKLTDLGVAVMGSHKQLEFVETSAGTPCYESPEICADTRRVTFASDVWSLGIAMGRLLYGVERFWVEPETWKPMFATFSKDRYGRTQLEEITKKKDPASFPGEVSIAAKKLLFKMLAVTPSYRIAATAIGKDEWIKGGGDV